MIQPALPSTQPAGLPSVLHGVPGQVVASTRTWLHRQRSEQTRKGYRHDLQLWLVHCAGAGVDPLHARPADLDGWIIAQRLRGARGGRPAAERTIARRLAAVSSWYDYLVANTAEDPQPLVRRNPVPRAGRPRLNPNYSPTIGLSAEEMDRLLAAADSDSATSCARIRLLFTGGLRVGSALGAQVADLGHDQGHRTLDVRVKGRADDQPDRIPLPPVVDTAVAAMLAERGDPTGGPLFVTPTGRPIYHMYVYRLVKRLARRAHIAAFDKLTPHGLRATAITLYLDATGGDVRGAQRFAGHARPETTIGYDKRRMTYASHGAYVLAGRFGTVSQPAPSTSEQR
jgi:integrase/recombinase XerD